MWQSNVHQSRQARYKTLKRSELSLEVNCKKPERHYVAELPGLATLFTIRFGELPSIGLYTIKQRG